MNFSKVWSLVFTPAQQSKQRVAGYESGTAHQKRPRRLARPRTPAFHADNTGSNPVGDANKSLTYCRSVLLQIFLETIWRQF